jgi:hypothetical protein
MLFVFFVTIAMSWVNSIAVLISLVDPDQPCSETPCRALAATDPY